MIEKPQDFERRKKDHIAMSLREEGQSSLSSGFDRIRLIHEALPQFDLADVDISACFLEHRFSSPFYLSSMTAGHFEGVHLNQTFAIACEKMNWLMGIGSQRRQLFDPEAQQEWKKLRKVAPQVKLLGNIGITQLRDVKTAQMEDLVGSIDAIAMIVHINPLQECLQPEGTPVFAQSFENLQRVSEELSVPLIVKETGCGFSLNTLNRLGKLKLAAIDVSGLGGTHWGNIEGMRSSQSSLQHQAYKNFSAWGIQTADCLKNALKANLNCMIWASGGIRSGVDGAKSIAFGASMLGLAQPMLAAAMKNELEKTMQRFDFELKTALFCTGHQNLKSLRLARPVQDENCL